MSCLETTHSSHFHLFMKELSRTGYHVISAIMLHLFIICTYNDMPVHQKLNQSLGEKITHVRKPQDKILSWATHTLS